MSIFKYSDCTYSFAVQVEITAKTKAYLNLYLSWTYSHIIWETFTHHF